MFMRNIREIAVIGKGSIKWDESETQSEAPDNLLLSKIAKIPKDSNNPFDFIVKRKELLNTATDAELNKLKEVIKNQK